MGYQSTANFLVGASIGVSVIRKDSVGRELDVETGVTRFPSTTLVSIFPAIGAYWSFY